MTEKHNELLQGALSLAECGFRVFPCVPNKKVPAIKEWGEKATTDESQIKLWWRINPKYNIGIAMGKGLVALDYDEDESKGTHGLKIYNNWQQERPFPKTVSVRTPRGGLHQYYRVTQDQKTRTGLYLGVDVRGNGGLVIAPPSVVNGKAYEWVNSPFTCPIADADSNVYTFLNPVDENAQEKEKAYKAETYLEGTRVTSLVSLAGKLISEGMSPEAAEAALRVENETKCDPPLSDDELNREVLPALHRGWKATRPYDRERPINPHILETVKALDPADGDRYGRNDSGSARLFMDVCGDRIRYVTEQRMWFYYDGVRWVANEAAVKELLKKVADALNMYVVTCIQDESKKMEYLKFYGKWQQLRVRETILKDAQSIAPVKLTEFDCDPYLLNCRNGVLNLKDFSFREHNSEDMLSKVANVEYKPDITCGRWESFISEIFDKNKELAEYAQKFAGYSLTGDTKHECLFVLYGPTSRNGKSTFLNVLSAVLGDYAVTGSPETLAKKKFANGSSPTPDLARLAGVRQVHMPEPQRGLELNGGIVKQLTAGDKLTARHLNAENFEFTPQFKIAINTNYLPRIDDLAVFKSGRMRVIPFKHHFSETERELDLKAKLTSPKALSGVLNWCIDGLKMLEGEGFKLPEAAQQATEEYRMHEDKLARFVKDCCEESRYFKDSIEHVHGAFTNWCMSSDINTVSRKAMREMLTEHGYACSKSRINNSKNPVAVVSGLRVKESE